MCICTAISKKRFIRKLQCDIPICILNCDLIFCNTKIKIRIISNLLRQAIGTKLCRIIQGNKGDPDTLLITFSVLSDVDATISA